jgi:hypothetical protein
MPDPTAASQGIAFADVSSSNSTRSSSNTTTTASNSTAASSTMSKAGAMKAMETGMGGPMGAAGLAALFGMVAVAGL